MTEYALLTEQGKKRRIVNVVTTSSQVHDVRERYPDYEVALLHELPGEVREAYQFWDSRP